MEFRDKIERYVLDRLNEYLKYNSTSGFDKDHIIYTGVSILETQYPEIGPGYSGGSFVQSIVDNDLCRAVGNADSDNIKFLKFYCQLMYCFSPREIGYKTY